MKTVKYRIPWIDNQIWAWPKTDTKLLQVIDWVEDLGKVINLFTMEKLPMRTCIQAGGACGIWPIYLSSYFEKVKTFESESKNFNVMAANIARSGKKNIIPYFASLHSAYRNDIEIKTDVLKEAGNCGAYFIQKSDNFGCRVLAGSKLSYTIDGPCLSNIDFICLDVEGMEYDVLLGAEKVLKNSNPVVMIEEKPLPHMGPGDHLKARDLLVSIGYQEAFTVHRDVVFVR